MPSSPPPSVLHTADWHLGRKLNRRSRIDEQREVLASLADLADELDPDVAVVSGDVFDFFTPAADAEELYYDAVRTLARGGERAVLVVAGNHDSAARLTAPRDVLQDLGVIVAGDPHDPADVPDPRAFPGFELADAGPGWVVLEIPDRAPSLFHLLPFPSRSRLPPEVESQDAGATEIVRRLQDDLPHHDGPAFLVSHLLVTSRRADVEEDHEDFVGGAYAVDPSALDRYDASFLGHLHRPHGSDGWRYAGAPLLFDFDDPTEDRGGWLWDDGTWSYHALDGGEVPTVVEAPDAEDAVARARDEPSRLVRLELPPGTVLTPDERRRIRDAWGDRLVDIQFPPPEETSPADDAGALRLGELDPEAAFERFHREQAGEDPPEALTSMFLDVLGGEDA